MKLYFFLFAFTSLCAHYVDPTQNHILFVESDRIEYKTLCDKMLYSQVVAQLPVCCVDVFVYDTEQRTYFLVLRDCKPLKDTFFTPGGRLFKGESFFECAVRKCKEECGLIVRPVAVLDVYSTIFPDSAWGCQTHTVNIAIMALYEKNQKNPVLDINHGTYRWAPIEEVPDNPYLYMIYEKALEAIKRSL